ncbi:condensation domain-containing protein [Gordonia bronchialis]|uniref:condensation domain-containing protein n=1 Tax=Gordonia bronchialis TaxID=2054 RepID=UPI00226ECD7A|nr:condensation domain-containing protein [Gordonia bronchialis]
MEYTELKDYRLPGGTLVDWEPTADANRWYEDPRRLSYMHAEHVRRAIDAGDRWGSMWIGTAFRIEARLDRAAMASTIECWYQRHEAFRTRVQELPDALPGDVLTRFTLPADAVSVRPRTIGTALTGDEVGAAVSEYFDRAVSPLRWPHCLFVTVEPDDGQGFVVVFGADHTAMDAYTQVFAIRELTTLFTAAVSGVPHGLRGFGSYLDFSDAERELGDKLDANSSAVNGWRAFFESTVTPVQPEPMPSFPAFPADDPAPITVSPPRQPDPGFQASLSLWLLDAVETERFHTICKAGGASMASGIYTALSMATSRLTGTGDLRFISPVHTRMSAEWGEAAGWFVGIIPVALRSGGAESFSSALAPISRSADQFKSVGGAPFTPIADLIGGDTTPPGFVVSYIDLRRDPGAAEWEARAARVLRSAVADADEVYFWINRIPGGTNVSARYPAGGSTRKRVELFLTVFREILHEIVSTGDAYYTRAVDTSRAQAR